MEWNNSDNEQCLQTETSTFTESVWRIWYLDSHLVPLRKQASSIRWRIIIKSPTRWKTWGSPSLFPITLTFRSFRHLCGFPRSPLGTCPFFIAEAGTWKVWALLRTGGSSHMQRVMRGNVHLPGVWTRVAHRASLAKKLWWPSVGVNTYVWKHYDEIHDFVCSCKKKFLGFRRKEPTGRKSLFCSLLILYSWSLSWKFLAEALLLVPLKVNLAWESFQHNV